MSFSTQPQSLYLDTIEQLKNWQAGQNPYDNFNVAQVPLMLRPQQPQGPRVHDCNDFKGGYLPGGDLYPQGTDNIDTYNFTFWQYLDNFCYFAHHRVTIPTAWWINAAHLNGVPMLGNLIFEGGSESELAEMLGNISLYVSKLAGIAQYYGFDGWFLNFEAGLSQGIGYQSVVNFEQQLLAGLKTFNPQALVIWYDSLTTGGYVYYQNQLNSQNNPFFVASSGILPNYGWDQGGTMIQQSVQQAKADNRSPYDVYTGIDSYARGTWYQPGDGNPGNDAVSAVGVCTANGSSVGLFAPGWPYDHASGTVPSLQHHINFEAQDTLFWIGQGAGNRPGNSTDCVAQYIPERIAPGLVGLTTNFDRGCSTMMAVRGQQVGSSQWSNLSLQGLQPAYRFWCVSGNADAFALSFDETAAYDGGASLLVAGTASSQASSTATYRLFDLQMPASALQYQLIFQPLQASSYPSLQLKFVYSDGSSYTTSQAPVQQGGWWSLSGSAPSRSGQLVQILLAAGPFTGGNAGPGYGVRVGLLSVCPSAQPFNTAGSLAAQPIYSSDSAQGAWLTWKDSGARPSRFFDIWQQNGASYTWLMRVCCNNAWIPNLVPVNASGSFTFVVQPVNYQLNAPPLSACSAVNIDFDAMQFNDGPTVALLGNPVITGISVWSGEILNALQATNGSNTLPQHGDTSGGQAQITFDPGDELAQVSGYTGNWFGRICVCQISLKTRNGKVYGPYGNMNNVSGATPFNYAAQAGQSILAFSGSLVNVPLAGGAPNVDIIESLGVAEG